MGENKSLKELILERIEQRELTADKVVQMTDIPRHYFDALVREEADKLPAAPYIRGYLQKIAVALELDAHTLWEMYKVEQSPKASGSNDRLPENRFAIKSKKAGWGWLAVLAVVAIAYLGINAGQLFGKPSLSISQPASETEIVGLADFLASGVIDPKDKILINREEVFVDQSGKFQKSVSLQPGLNTLEFTVKRFLGRETTEVRKVIYQPEENIKEIKTTL